MGLIRGSLWIGQTVGNIARNHSERVNKRDAKYQARKLEKKVENNDTTGVHDSKPMAGKAELEANGNYDPTGNFVCFDDDGRMVTSTHDSHSLTTGKPGIGKTSQMGLAPVLHSAARSSIICVDVDYEFTRSLKPFLERMGIRCINLNPSRAYNILDAGYSPLMIVKRLLGLGEVERALMMAKKLAKILIPVTDADNGNNGWITKGARRWLWITIIAECSDRKVPTFTHIYERLIEGPQEAILWVNGATLVTQALMAVKRFENELASNADKQAFWQIDNAADALDPFARGTDLANSTARHSIDFGDCKKRPTCVFLNVESDRIKEDYGSWLSMVLASAFDEVAAASGDRTVQVFADEFSTIPAIPDFLTSMLAYRKRLLQLHLFAHSPEALERRYGKGQATEIQSACGVVRYMSPDYPTAEKLSKLSGTRTIYAESISVSQRLDASGNKSVAEQSKPQMSVAEVSSLADDELLVQMQGLTLLKGKRKPWWEVSPWNDGRIVDIRTLPDTRHERAPLAPLEE